MPHSTRFGLLICILLALPAYADSINLSQHGADSSKSLLDRFALLSAEARNGDPDAQDSLASCYLNGWGVERDNSAAKYWFLKAAEQGFVNSQYALGWMYAQEVNETRNMPEAIRWLTLAGNKGHIKASLILGYVYQDGLGVPRDSITSEKWYRTANPPPALAELISGEFQAITVPPVSEDLRLTPLQSYAIENFDVLKFIGIGYVESSDASTVLYWRNKFTETQLSAAVQNGTLETLVYQMDVSSIYNVGVRYAIVESRHKSPREAVRWYTLAAERGNVAAQRDLGWCYAEGIGVPRDPSKAMLWLRKAASQNDTQATVYLYRIFSAGEGTPENEIEEINWIRWAAENGQAWAQNNLGVKYSRGEGVANDAAEAARWYRMAADQDNPSAQLNLGVLYVNGRGVPRDEIEATKWFLRAALNGNTKAQGMLGTRYSQGVGVPKDEIEGLAWISIAAISAPEDWLPQRDFLEHRLGKQSSQTAQRRIADIWKNITKSNMPSSLDAEKQASTSASVPQASGSGAIISPKGYILTAAHVVKEATRLRIVTSSGIKNASVIRVDEANDVALLKLEAGTYMTLPIAPSSGVRLGQTVATIGFPNIQIQGFSPKVTKGEISSMNGFGDDPRTWQISVPVQTGNSGGPLLDANGNIIGVVVSKLGLTAAARIGDIPQNVNYAVKSAYAVALLDGYRDDTFPKMEEAQSSSKFEDVVAKAQQAIVLILAY